jgi:hypothetical protein
MKLNLRANRLLDVWLKRMKLMENTDELFSDGEKLFNMLEKMCGMKVRISTNRCTM